MKTYDERTDSIRAKADALRSRRRKQLTALSLCFVLVLGLVLFMPYNDDPPFVGQHAGSDYYDVIQKLNAVTYRKPQYDNFFDEIVNENIFWGDAANGGSMEAVPDAAGPSGSYEEITDNQVAGVVEGDLIKRSDKYIYYLSGLTLKVYDIAKDESKEVGSYTIENQDGYRLQGYVASREMFLSADCTTITFLCPVYNNEAAQKYVCTVSLDVSDPENIRETGRTYLTGNYNSARLIDGTLMLISNFYVGYEPDFNNEAAFLPQYGTAGDLRSIAPDKIISPDELTSPNYTVVAMVDQKTLEAKDAAAFLSYTGTIYVSRDKLYATRSFTKQEELEENQFSLEPMTEISCLSYTNGLKLLGSVQVAGTVLNQYSMDEFDGILRVVTTTSTTIRNHVYGDDFVSVRPSISFSNNSSASLYCIDTNSWKVVASVENFAPKGETVRSVRFDGVNAYVCTAVQLTDPVFFFDLSDLDNITYKDTGTIDGYSSSLVDFADGVLLGVGYGGAWDALKIELYRESPTGVESICAYELPNTSFASSYKAYYIDRKNRLIGLGVDIYQQGSFYILLQFDGYELVELVKHELPGDNNAKRAVLIDGWLYMFGDTFAVQQVF